MATPVLCRVKRTFPYSEDGITVVFLGPGGEHLLDLASPVYAEGWVERVVLKTAKPK